MYIMITLCHLATTKTLHVTKMEDILISQFIYVYLCSRTLEPRPGMKLIWPIY